MATKPVHPLAAAPRQLTPEIVDAVKAALEQMGLPPRIYKFTAEGEDFVFRPLYRSDWHDIQSWVQANPNITGPARQDHLDRMICERALLWPEESRHPQFWDFQRAGFQMSLAKKVLARSCFFDAEEDQSSYLRVDPLEEPDPGPKPDDSVKQELRAKYHRWRLLMISAGGDHYIVRPLTRLEWKPISVLAPEEMDLQVAETATIWSDNYPNKPDFSQKLGGVVAAISQVVMDISGFFTQAMVVEEL